MKRIPLNRKNKIDKKKAMRNNLYVGWTKKKKNSLAAIIMQSNIFCVK